MFCKISPPPFTAPLTIPTVGFILKVIFLKRSFLGKFQTNDYYWAAGLGTEIILILGIGTEVPSIFETAY